MPNLWRSKRLIYRACEEDDEPFLFSIHENGSESLVNATRALPIPPGKAGAKRHREGLHQALCGVIICLPSAPEASASTAPQNPEPKPTPIGSVSLRTADRLVHHRHADIGITIAQRFQGKGYGSEALEWIIEFGFRHANLHRIEIGAFGWNEGAIRLYQRLGFVLEGRMRETAWHDGQYMDIIKFGMLEHEWRERQEKKTESGTQVQAS